MDRLVLLAGLLAAAAPGWCYEDGAPPGHTAGFGEPDCSACHSDSPKNPPEGRLAIEGLPERFEPGRRYELALVLEHPDLRAGGFQLSIRSADGEPAGEMIPLSGRSQVVSGSGQNYLQHTKEGRKPPRAGAASWRFAWTAGKDSAPVHLHVAANAANDDVSALGDYIFTLERVLPAASAETGSRRKR